MAYVVDLKSLDGGATQVHTSMKSYSQLHRAFEILFSISLIPGLLFEGIWYSISVSAFFLY